MYDDQIYGQSGSNQDNSGYDGREQRTDNSYYGQEQTGRSSYYSQEQTSQGSNYGQEQTGQSSYYSQEQTGQGSYYNQEPKTERTDYTHRYEEDIRYAKPKKRKTKKPSFFKSLVKTVALALVFGLVASGVFIGTTKLAGVGQSEAASEEQTTVNVVKISSESVETVPAEGVADVVTNVMPSIVAVNTTIENVGTDWFGRQYTQESAGAGSGIIISEADGQLYVLTNYHVVEGAKNVSLQFADGSSADATVKGYDEDGDLAVVQLSMDTLEERTKKVIKVAVMGDSDSLHAGEGTIAIGNALGYGQSVTTGVVSATGRDVSLTDKTMTLIQTSAAINPGNSGGALLNARGEVIGINTVKFSETSVEGIGFAIPINTAIETATGIIEGTIVPATDENTAFLGITGGTLDEETAKMYNAPAGVYISNVQRGSAADRAGLSGGCIITGFNGVEIESMEQLQEEIAKCKPGDNVTIVAEFALRNGGYQEQTLTTIMGSRADADIQ